MWCKTQAVVTLSSAEVELYGLVRASVDSMGLTSMYKDLGTHMNGVVLGDASAALANVARRRLGKLRHLDTNYLWIQEKAAGGDLNVQRVGGIDNEDDLFTKTLTWKVMQSHIHKLNSQFLPDEVSVNHVGAPPNGVNLPQVLRDMSFAGGRNLAAWTRTDMGSRTHNEGLGTHAIGEPRDIQTILVCEAPNTRSPSPILQDSVRRGARDF